MTERSVTHATFVIERTYAATPARVFAAFASRAAKASWFQGPAEWGPSDHELDFKVGGRERVRGGPKGGPIHSFDARFQDIVPNQRISRATTCISTTSGYRSRWRQSSSSRRAPARG
jgi:uncharacterized protein YndB with AHSA1/START domain